MRKYIKGKNGKFKGSVPDGTTKPKSLGEIPSKGKESATLNPSSEQQASTNLSEYAKAFYAEYAAEHRATRPLARPEYLTHDTTSYSDAYVDIYEEGFATSVESKVSKSHGAGAMLDEETRVIKAEVLSSYFGYSETLDEKEFSDMDSATQWMKDGVNKRTQLIKTFRTLLDEDPNGLIATLEIKLEEAGREDLIPLETDRFLHPDGITIGDSRIEISRTSYPFGLGVRVSKNDGSKFAGEHEFQNNSESRAILYGLFVAFSE